MDSSTNWNLRLRMVASLLLLSAFTVGFVAAVWVVFLVLSLLLFSPGAAPAVAAVATIGVLGAIGYLECEQLSSVEELADAEPVTAEEWPDLHAIVSNVAAHMDVPAPTIAITERRTPEAMVVGVRRESTHLVLSYGTLEALDAEEIQAVVAHELAHVANRDAMVMTIVSIPARLADGLRSRLLSMLAAMGRGAADGLSSTRSNRSWWVPRLRLRNSRSLTAAVIAVLVVICTKLVLLTVATVTWIASRTIVAVLSRTREIAADRTAADVVGSPVPVASALQRLDDRIADTPRQDLREASSVSSLSIVSLEPQTVEPVRRGPAGQTDPFLWSVRAPLLRAKRRLFRTHPPTDARIDELAALQEE